MREAWNTTGDRLLHHLITLPFAVVLLSYRWVRVSLQIEQHILRQVRPPYNDRIAQED